MTASGTRRYALIMAGGTGSRLGAGVPKQMIALKGRPVLAHTVDRFLEFDPEMTICLVLHASLVPEGPAFVRRHFPDTPAGNFHFCEGGTERTDSVRNGLRYLARLPREGRALVAIHDGVRPFIDARILREGFALAAEKGNAVAGVPVKSSLRMRTDTGSKAIDRSRFFHVQTPQVFDLDALLECYENPPEGVFTDDAGLAEACGQTIHLFTGSYDNIKITTAEDLLLAERLLERRSHK